MAIPRRWFTTGHPGKIYFEPCVEVCAYSPELLQPRGMPVLFIPGNSGSFKQVRSIASSAAHQFHEREEQSGSSIGFVDDYEATKNWKELDFFAGKHAIINQRSGR